MRIGTPALLCLTLLLAACAGNRMAVDHSGDGEYVEVTNPAFTMSPGAPATIWVKRESVNKGVPRGGVLLKKGYDSVVDEIKRSPQPVQPQASPVQPHSAPVQPQATPVQPQATPVQPQSAPAQPQSTPAQPQSTPAQPETLRVMPYDGYR